jgi:hypothetical protein
MRNAERACERELARIERLRPGTSEGPAKLFLTARVLDRAATLALLAFNDVTTASRDVALANLYFRVAAGLPDQPANYRAAAAANVELTHAQLVTLRPDLAARPTGDDIVIAQTPCTKTRHIGACARPTPTVYTAYHTHN